MVVIGIPLWSLMTRVVTPFTGLLTATRPFFPAERITWPARGGGKKVTEPSWIKCSSFHVTWHLLAEHGLNHGHLLLITLLCFDPWQLKCFSFFLDHYISNLLDQTRRQREVRLRKSGSLGRKSPAKILNTIRFWHHCPLSPLAEYWMAVTATWWGCSFISISEEASLKILKVPSLYPAATHALSLLEEGLQHTQPQAWHKDKQERVLLCVCVHVMVYSECYTRGYHLATHHIAANGKGGNTLIMSCSQ